MNKIASLLIVGAVLAFPGTSFATDCGCENHAPAVVDNCNHCNHCHNACHTACHCNPCNDCCQPRQRTRLKLVCVQKEVCRRQRVCSTDACGCPTMRTVRVKKCVRRLALVRVPVQIRQRCCHHHSDCGCGCN